MEELDVQKEMEIMLTQIKFPDGGKHLFERAEIERVQIFKSNKRLHVSFLFHEVIKPEQLLMFFDLFEETFAKIPSFDSIGHQLKYKSQPDDAWLKRYLPYMIDHASKEIPFVRTLESMDIEFESGHLHVFVADEKGKVEIERDYAQLLIDAYDQFGFTLHGVHGIVTTSAKSDAQMMQEKTERLGTITTPPPQMAATL